MTENEKILIHDAITLASRYDNGGVRTIVWPKGIMATNYVSFRTHFQNNNFSKKHQRYALKIWRKTFAG